MSTGEFMKGDLVGGETVDLTNCDREPIHIPGSIQPHGILFALEEATLTIQQVSNNVQVLLGRAPEQLLQQPLSILLDADQIALLKRDLQQSDLARINPVKIVFSQDQEKHVFDAVLHRTQGMLVVELERAQTREYTSFPSFYHVVRTSAITLQGAASLHSLTQSVAEEVRKITGFDRVMIYRFDKDWNGEVIAEDRREDLEPYLGLHYPASDIPQQARDLYRRNWLRLIADVTYRPAALVPSLNPQTGQPLDLSFSVLRSVSPIHIEYLKNMGVGASMSVSILKNNQLWGLISCHHMTACYVSYATRMACEFLGQILSLQLSAKEDIEDYAYEVRVKDLQTRLLENILQQETALDGVTRDKGLVLDVVGAQGAALVFHNQYTLIGQTPSEESCQHLIVWLKEVIKEDVFVTNSLPSRWTEAQSLKDVASGLLAIAISPEQGDYLLWFRPEVLQTVQWGGDPTKPVEFNGSTAVLHPRKSFEVWTQTVSLSSLPWKRSEIEAARSIRSALIDRILRQVVLQRAEELARLNAELAQSNSELDAFAYIASHDLKEPLRGIHNYARILQEDYADQLGQNGTERIETLLRLTRRMDGLIDALLHYSRVGRVDLAFAETDLNEVLRRTLDMLSLRIEETGVEIRIPHPFPTLWCDRVRVGEIFNNLITNAIKYNDKPEKWIEIGYLRSPRAEDEQANLQLPLIFYVRDNGIGIREKYYSSIFRIFKRLHGRTKYGGGTGAGLTIVKRIVERHGGSIWVESEYGVGTTFYFTLQKGREP